MPDFSSFDRFIRRQEVGAELAGFLRRPSMVGATMMLREGSQTRAMLTSLGKTGMAAGTALLAIGAVAGSVTLALSALQAASNHVAGRIEQTWQYSVGTAASMAEKQIMQVGMAAEEAARNGKMYAEVIRSQTAVEVEQTKLHIQLAKTTSELTLNFNQFMLGFMKFATVYVELFQTINAFTTQLAQYAPVVFSAKGYYMGFTDISGSGLNILQSLRLAFNQFVGDEEEYNRLQNEYMNEIVRNTRKDAMDTANDWFQADIQYLTGSRF